MCERIDREITKNHLSDLYQITMNKIRLQRESHNDKQRAGYDLCNPFGVALCQGAAMHYLGKPSLKDGVEHVGVKDFDIWCFYKKVNEKFLFGGQVKFKTEYFSEAFGERCVDIMMRAIDYKGSAIKSIQNWLETSSNQSPKCLSRKAVVMICPQKYLGQSNLV